VCVAVTLGTAEEWDEIRRSFRTARKPEDFLKNLFLDRRSEGYLLRQILRKELRI
jgi:hypothetical protein